MTTTAVNRHTRPPPMPTSTGVAFAPLVLAVLLLVGGLTLSTGMGREDVVDGVAMMSFPPSEGFCFTAASRRGSAGSCPSPGCSWA